MAVDNGTQYRFLNDIRLQRESKPELQDQLAVALPIEAPEYAIFERVARRCLTACDKPSFESVFNGDSLFEILHFHNL